MPNCTNLDLLYWFICLSVFNTCALHRMVLSFKSGWCLCSVSGHKNLRVTSLGQFLFWLLWVLLSELPRDKLKSAWPCFRFVTVRCEMSSRLVYLLPICCALTLFVINYCCYMFRPQFLPIFRQLARFIKLFTSVKLPHVCAYMQKLSGWRIKHQLDVTYSFIVLLISSTCFGHYYAHHQELATMMLITTLVVPFLVCCRLEVRCG